MHLHAAGHHAASPLDHKWPFIYSRQGRQTVNKHLHLINLMHNIEWAGGRQDGGQGEGAEPYWRPVIQRTKTRCFRKISMYDFVMKGMCSDALRRPHWQLEIHLNTYIFYHSDT